jgi:hypothetical protein
LSPPKHVEGSARIVAVLHTSDRHAYFARFATARITDTKVAIAAISADVACLAAGSIVAADVDVFDRFVADTGASEASAVVTQVDLSTRRRLGAGFCTRITSAM